MTAEIPTQQFEFSSIQPAEASFGVANKQLEALQVKLIKPFEDNADNRIKVFVDGNAPFSPLEKKYRRSFIAQSAEVVRRQCAELFTDTGEFVSDEARNTFTNISELAPSITKVIVGSDNYISMVQQNQSLHVVEAAIMMAKNPDTRVAIRTGFGGSDDDFTPARLPAYGIPAMRILDGLSQIYSKRESTKMRQAANKKGIDTVKEYLNIDFLSQGQRASIAQEIDSIGVEAVLTGDEQEEVRRKAGILQQLPTAEFFFAHQAAIAINTVSQRMDPEKIPGRTAQNMEAMKGFIDGTYPDISSAVEYREDVPWDEHQLGTRVAREYLAHLLKSSTDPAVMDTIATLQELGNNHGGDNGAENAAEYAAIHPLVFRDQLAIPSDGYFGSEGEAVDVNITIGGRSERHFCAVRDFLRREANSDGLVDFVKNKIAKSEDQDERINLQQVADDVEAWEEQRLIDPQEQIGISLITDIGHKPVYYATEYDVPQGTDLKDAIEMLAQTEVVLQQATGQESALQRENLRGVLFDITALHNARLN